MRRSGSARATTRTSWPAPDRRAVDRAARATAYPAETAELYLADLIVAETVDVLESFYEAPREQVATAMRSLVSMRSLVTVDPSLLLQAIEVYEIERLDFAEAYLVACAESTGVGRVASVDRSIDRGDTVHRAEPWAGDGPPACHSSSAVRPDQARTRLRTPLRR